jgi:hypothetical protein
MEIPVGAGLPAMAACLTHHHRWQASSHSFFISGPCNTPRVKEVPGAVASHLAVGELNKKKLLVITLNAASAGY